MSRALQFPVRMPVTASLVALALFLTVPVFAPAEAAATVSKVTKKSSPTTTGQQRSSAAGKASRGKPVVAKPVVAKSVAAKAGVTKSVAAKPGASKPAAVKATKSNKPTVARGSEKPMPASWTVETTLGRGETLIELLRRQGLDSEAGA